MDRNLLVDIQGLKGRFSIAGLLKKRTQEAPDWPQRISGFSYSPFRPGQHPGKKTYPSRAQIEEDLALLSAFTRNIRTYAVSGSLACIPEVAQGLGMTVTLGTWISQDERCSQAELSIAVDLANHYANIDRLLVGNETLYRGDVTLARLLDYMAIAKQQVRVPVATSEPWMYWIDMPELALHSDFISAHILPFWQAIPVENAVAEVMSRAEQLHQTFPDKPVILAEIGWPGRGSAARRIFTSPTEQCVYLRNQLHQLNQRGYAYFVVEAFDQHWKTDEGIPGPHWGVFNAKRKLKMQLTGPVKVPVNWRLKYRRLVTRLLTSSQSSAIAITALAYATLTAAGLAASSSLDLWLALPLSLIWAFSLLAGVAIETHEFLEACWGQDRSRIFLPRLLQGSDFPKVSVHVPCYNEPPDMVMLTLDHLHRLNYPCFEVLVIDNNTHDANVWEPVERHCRQLGSRFQFFHIDPLSGFKAGALNYLIDRTAADAEIVAVIDADYCVNPLWLKHMVPHFADPRIGVIQSPQDYRDGDESLFKRCCEAEYRGFFNIGMVIRNDHDAIIQHGTMTIIRHSILKRLRWAQWSICEDAELGLRVLENDFATGYSPISYGRGLIPDTFSHFKKQRYRWAYGAVQIVKRHAESLITGRSGSLNLAQRYHYLAGWLPWATEGLGYLLTFIVLLWTAAMMLAPQSFGPLPWLFSASLMLMFVFRAGKIISLYGQMIGRDISEALAAILAGMALYPTIGKAVISGIFTSRLPFFRTPKMTAGSRYGQALLEASGELWILTLFWLAALGLCFSEVPADLDLWMWVAMLLVKSLPYLAAAIMAALSALAGSTTDTAT